MSPHSALTVTLLNAASPSSSCTALSASSRARPVTMMALGPNGASSRATAMPTRPEPPSSNTVRFSMSIEFRSGVQSSDLGGLEQAPLRWRQIGEQDRAKAHALQPDHWMPNRGKQPPYFALPSFSECDLQARFCRRSRNHFRIERAGRSVLELHTAEQPFTLGRRNRACYEHFVHATDFITRVLQTMRAIAVVRQQDKPLRVVVQPPHVKKPPVFRREQFIDRVPALGITARGKVPGRFVKRDPHRAGRLDFPPVDLDLVFARNDARAQLLHDNAVLLHATGQYQFFRLAP